MQNEVSSIWRSFPEDLVDRTERCIQRGFQFRLVLRPVVVRPEARIVGEIDDSLLVDSLRLGA